ncbi:hypothetical protein [Acetobacter thailandicus]|uniref:Uncharacterized protein n=1 Tax=Acetobacter thailandicus TaxID=1502842 RepID=A0ABT3QDL7_9PROT|nr:hypothetical protein [Acetobacter thailandicus]MCX2563382.1 hypothetical protein [Acetobacter thailandicus]NHN94135.1 hypothetical protein [Acetobacter thailandicus]
MIQGIKNFCKNDRIPNTVGFLAISAVLSLGISVGTDRFFKWYDDGQDKRDKQVSTFIQSANSLDALVGFYIEAITQGHSSIKDAKDKLYANLVDQAQKAREMEITLNPEEKKKTEKYIAKIDHLISILQKPDSSDVLKVKDFWESVADIISYRNEWSVSLES